MVTRLVVLDAGDVQLPDASGEAALLLAETMLHVLLDARVLTRNQVLDVVETAMEVRQDDLRTLWGEHGGERRVALERSLGLLRRMNVSLRSAHAPH